MSIVVLVPSRGRPDRAALMAASAIRMAASPVRVVLTVDADDPDLGVYQALPRIASGLRPHLLVRTLPERLGYTASLNLIAREEWDAHDILGAFGDDVIFRTPGWDRIVERTLETPGIAYGDDLIHGANHPTAVFMSSVIAKALDWLALPATTHQWADDGWKRLGQDTGLLRFMPDVIVEHMHVGVGKAEWDDTYRSVFDEERAKRDHAGFAGWVESGLAADAERVRAVAA